MTAARGRASRGGIGGLPIPLLLFVLAGAALWTWEAVRLVRGRATPAVVEASSMRTVMGSSGRRTYAPDVAYRYEVDGISHTSRAVLASSRSSDEAWARALAARFPVGAHITAYVDPSDPTRAFLVRRPSAALYIPIVAPLALLAMLSGFSGAVDSVPPPDPVPDERHGVWQVLPIAPVEDEARRRDRAARRWHVTVAVLLVPYLAIAAMCAAGSIGALWEFTLGDGFFLFELVAIAGATWVLARQRRIAHTVARVGDAVVTLDVPAVRVGDRITVRVAVPGAQQPGAPAVRRVLVGVRWDTAQRRGATKPAPEHAERWVGLVGEPPANTPTPVATESSKPGEAPGGWATFDILGNARPSSLDASARPFTIWAILVRVAIDGAGEEEFRYPLWVDAARA